jgi:hypothetical protein
LGATRRESDDDRELALPEVEPEVDDDPADEEPDDDAPVDDEADFDAESATDEASKSAAVEDDSRILSSEGDDDINGTSPDCGGAAS